MAIGLFVLWGLRPWEDDSTAPQRVPLGIETRIGDGSALPVAPATSVAAAAVARTGPEVGVGPEKSKPAGDRSADEATDAARPTLAIAQAQAVTVSPGTAAPSPTTPATPPPTAPEAQPVSATPTAPATVPAATPVTTNTEGASPGRGPVSAGGGGFEESCEGDEYLITITFLDEESTVEEAPVDIVLERLNEDGTSDELQLEGDLGDARALASTLEAEGNCVEVEVAWPEAEKGEKEVPGASEEAPESGEEPTEPAESPVPGSP